MMRTHTYPRRPSLQQSGPAPFSGAVRHAMAPGSAAADAIVVLEPGCQLPDRRLAKTKPANPAAAVLAALPGMRQILDHKVWLDIDLAVPDVHFGQQNEHAITLSLQEAAKMIAGHRPNALRIWIRIRLLAHHAVLLIADDGGPEFGIDKRASPHPGLASLIRLAIALSLPVQFRRFHNLNVVSLQLPVRRPHLGKQFPRKEISHENRQPIAV